MIQSIVILKHENLGFVAELRFSDKTKDCSLSAYTQEAIHKEIMEYINGK